MLRRLLDSAKLTPSEWHSVRQMHEALVAGRVGGLTEQQSVWVAPLCQRCGIAVGGARSINAAKVGREVTARLLAEFDALPRPKKPPGRR